MLVPVKVGENYKMSDLKVKIKKLKPGATLPISQTIYSAGMDLCACLDAPLTIKPMERVIVPTGLSIELPDGYESRIHSRSGLSFRDGISMANGTGIIDADYRGEYGILLINFSDKEFVIEHGMRIAQLVISRYEHVTWDEVEELSETKRGTGGFGSTGK
jgi:dUTP pyrophosphatase